MQNFDLSIGLDKKGIMSQLDDMLSNFVITKEQADAVDAEKIAMFFESEIGKRMLRSDKVVRESSFEIALDASAVTGIENIDEQIVLHDLLEKENDGIIPFAPFTLRKGFNEIFKHSVAQIADHVHRIIEETIKGGAADVGLPVEVGNGDIFKMLLLQAGQKAVCNEICRFFCTFVVCDMIHFCLHCTTSCETIVS